jgi:hypothetical protein
MWTLSASRSRAGVTLERFCGGAAMQLIGFVVIAVGFLVATAASHAETAPLPVMEIAPGIFVHNGVHEEASAANEDAIANVGFIVGEDAVAVTVSRGNSPF